MRLITLFILIFTTTAYGEDSINLQFRYIENASFNIESEISSDMEMYYDGDPSQLPDKLREGLPSKVNSKNISLQNITTGSIVSNGSYPVEMIILKDRTFHTINGSRIIEPADSGKMEGIKILATGYPNGQIKYKSILGADKDLEKIAKSVLDQMQNSNYLSAENIKIGESTSKILPITIPIDNTQLSMNIEMLYTLTSINGNLAVFDITQNALLSTEMKSANINAQISGEGIMTYDIENQLSPETKIKMILNIEIPLQQGGKLNMISISDTKTLTTISK